MQGALTSPAWPVPQGPSATTDSPAPALLHRLWLGNSPRHSPRYGLSSWPHSTPTPRAASRPGYGRAHHLPARPAQGDAQGWLAGSPMGPRALCHLGGGTPTSPHSRLPGPRVSMQAPERPLVGVNGLDVTSLRPFDLVIPFTIKKGEITGEREAGRSAGARAAGVSRWAGLTQLRCPAAPQGRFACPQARWHSPPSLTTRTAP